MGEHLLIGLITACHLIIVIVALPRLLDHTSRLLGCIGAISRLSAELFRGLSHHILALLNTILHGHQLRRLYRA